MDGMLDSIGDPRARNGRHCRDDGANLKRLLDVSKAICSILDLDDLLQVVMANVLEVTRAERGILMLYDAAGELKVKVSKNFTHCGEEEKISRSVTRQVAQTALPVCVRNVHENEDVRCRKSVQELGLLSVMCVPLIIKKRTLGVIYVDSRRITTLFSDNSLRVFSSLAEHAAVAIENARLFEMAITDQKTGLYNHSHFRRRLEEAVEHYKRYGRPFALLTIDLDHFKAVNDGYGHQAGDHVLKEVACILKRSIRASDVAARYGGEEFTVILAETGLGRESPLATAERLRKAVAVAPIAWEDEKIPITASIGIADVEHAKVRTAESLIEEADRYLYRAKNLGRNRVCGHDCPSGE